MIFSGETESFFIVGMGKTAFTLPLASPTRAMMKHEGFLCDWILANATITPSRIAAPVANLPPCVDFIVQILDVDYSCRIAKLRQFPTQSLVDVFILFGLGEHFRGDSFMRTGFFLGGPATLSRFSPCQQIASRHCGRYSDLFCCCFLLLSFSFSPPLPLSLLLPSWYSFAYARRLCIG
jgi:hypothetical protein